MGDVLLTLPAVVALKRHLPGASFTYVVEEPFRELVENHPALDHILVLPRPVGNRDFFRFIRNVRKNRFDAVLDFHGGPKASLITLFSGAKRKIGYRIRYKGWIYHTTIPRHYDSGPVHSAENHFNLVRLLGVETQDSPAISFPPTDRKVQEEADVVLRALGLVSSKYIVFHVGAGNKFRFWGMDNMSAFLRQASEVFGLKIVLVGAPDDAETEKALLEGGHSSVVSLVGRIGLKILHRLISQAALYVGPDSGPMHIASATSTPIIALFGPTIPAQVGPWKSKCEILEKNLGCRPCRQRDCLSGDFACIRSIRPEEVIEAMRKYL
ncbi:MAG: glycosyltransferase family 9 protein [Acidobacteriota bacterium]